VTEVVKSRNKITHFINYHRIIKANIIKKQKYANL